MNMKKTIASLFTLIFASAPLCAQAQTGSQDKMDVSAKALIRQAGAAQTNSATGRTADPSFRLLIRATDTEAVAQTVEAMGGKAKTVADQMLSITVPASGIHRLADMDEVLRIYGPKKSSLCNDSAKVSTGVSQIHAGTGLDTPFKGQGVLIGIVDNGFQYNHPAFKDANGNSRIAKIWRQYVENEQPTSNITLKNDGLKDDHGTHVAGIAAGSEITVGSGTSAVNLGGMAPEATLLLATTDMYVDGILECMAWLKQEAHDRQQPMVINLSLGNLAHPCNSNSEALTPYDSYAGKGLVTCAAMGNDNYSSTHAKLVLENVGDEGYILLEPNNYRLNYIVGASEQTDSVQCYTYVPGIYDAFAKIFTPFSDETLENSLNFYWSSFFDIGSHQQCFIYEIPQFAALAEELGFSTGDVYPAIKLVATKANTTVHTWTEYNSFYIESELGVMFDDEYVCRDVAAASRVIGVGSYDNKSSYTTLKGETRHYGSSMPGGLSYFSNRGPLLGGNIYKPTVLTPGFNVCSSINDTVPTYDYYYVAYAIDSYRRPVTYDEATAGKEHFLYGMMSGTSMSSPAATGIIALWLQANPELTPEDVTEIIKQTAKHDDLVTGTQGEYQVGYGYGKMDAYAGLKKALQMAEETGVEQTLEADQPVTLQKTTDAWRVLFNITVPQAQVSVSTLGGAVVKSVDLGRQTRGSEQTIDLGGLQTGVYVVTISTPQAAVSRKFVK